MGSLSNYVELEVLDQIFGASDYAEPATLYIGLSKDDVLDDASGLNEPTGGDYAAVSVANNKTTWTTAAAGALSNAIEIAFPTASANWGTVTHFAIWIHATNRTASDLVGHGTLGAPKAIDSGDTAKFAVGELDITLD